MQRLVRILFVALAIAITTMPFASRGTHVWHGWELGGVTAAFAQTVGWSFGFAGQPAGPQPYSSPELDVIVHSRDNATLDNLEPMEAMHGADCSAPPATHYLSGRYEDAVFQCRDHVMTAIKAGGYGLIYLTPNQLVDFSQGEAVIRWDVSTLRSSSRDYLDIWISPFEDNLVAPFNMGEVDLQGRPKRAITARMDTFNGETVFRVFGLRDFVETDLGSCWWCGYESKLTAAGFPPSATRRDTFELRISRTHIKFWMPQYGITWIDKDLATPLDWSRGIVQFGHHSYNPTKACTDNGKPASECPPNTWHWDNMQISPAAPFTAIKANERVARSSSPALTFNTPAPQGSFLRVHAIGTALQVSTDNGVSWSALQRQAQALNNGGHFSSYWHPVPAGTSRVLLRGQNWYGGEWRTNYAAIWSNGGTGSTVPTSTPTTAPTNTPATPTSTPTAAPTNTPTAAPTNTPATPTSTPTAAPTNTPTVPTSTPTTAPTSCSPRPPISVATRKIGNRQLRVTMQATTSAGVPVNALRSIRIDSLQNAVVDVSGYGSISAGGTVNLASGTEEVQFTVRQTDAKAAATVGLTATDACGPWQTFVGGGSTGF